MELKSVFDIIKADRYTADGCKEIEDARRRYTVGQTSEATGKIKQPDGTWAPPEKEDEQSAKAETKKPSKDVQKKIDEFNKAKAGAQRAADFMNNIKSGMPMSQAFEQSRQEPKAETKTDKTVEAIRNGGKFEGAGNKVNVSLSFKKPANLEECKTYKTTLETAKKTQSKSGWRVDTSHEPQDYLNDQIVQTKGGSVAAVTPSGDIISVCKNANDREMTGSQLLASAVKAGGKKLDSYDGNFKFYVKNGFEPISWCKFDEKCAPEGWRKGTDEPENIIFFKYVGIDKVKNTNLIEFYKNIKVSTDYDEAQFVRDAEV